MIWKHWPVSKLQSELGSDLLGEIAEILPLIDTEGEGIFFETDKEKLVQLMSAFSDEKYFSDKENIKTCLNYLPPNVFKSLVLHLGKEDTGDITDIITNISNSVSKNTQMKCKFLEFFNLPKRFYPTKNEVKPSLSLINCPSYDNPITINSAYKVLKDFQYNIYYRTLDALTPNMARMILQMPTGSGKTRTVMELICKHFNSETGQKIRVVWLANSEELCEQAVACFMDVWQHVGRVNVEVQRVWGRNPKPKEQNYSTNQQFIVGSLQSLWTLVNADDKDFHDVFNKTSLLVIDEAHIAVAKTYSATVKKIAQISNTRVIGLTATPGRTVDEETTELSDLFHGEIRSLKDPTGEWDNAIAYLRSINVLSRVTYSKLMVDSQVDLSSTELKKLETELDFPEEILKKIGRSLLRSAEIASRLKPLLENGSSILLFAPSIENSKFLASLFSFLGFSAAHIDGNTDSKTRGQSIKNYTDRKIQIICNYGVLATGFDAPKTDVVCIARPTKSPVLYSQMIGRGLRGLAVGGTENCTVVEVIDNFIGQGTQDDLYKKFSEYWNSED